MQQGILDTHWQLVVLLSHMGVTSGIRDTAELLRSYFHLPFLPVTSRRVVTVTLVVYFDDMPSLNSISRPFDFLATLTFTSILRQYDSDYLYQ